MITNNLDAKKGFTLVELLVVISIIAIIIGVTMSNLVGARSRARDAVRKQNVSELRNALRLYYNDYQTYPTSNGISNSPQILGCGVNNPPDTLCPAGCANEFSAGATCATSTVYMKRLPRAPNGTDYEYSYYLTAGGDDFCLLIPLDNPADTGITVSQSRCTTACAGHAFGTADYAMCAD
jgi:prepilin-type N-terminal cleavage/methylation domain-containing protein